MIAALKKWLTPPVFETEAKSHEAYLLHVILWTLVFIPIPYLLYGLFFTPELIGRVSAQVIFGESVNAILLVMLRRGRVRAASILQVSAFWFFFTATAVTDKGVQTEAYLLGYGLVIVIAGVLLGGWGAFLFTALSLAAGGVMVVGESRGWIGPAVDASPLTTWITSAVLFPVGATLQYLASRTVKNALERARFSEERYRLISNVSADYVFSTELDEEGNMQLDWVAGAFETLTGYSYEEYVAKGGWHAHLHPDDAGKDAQDTATLKTNRQVVTEIRTFRKDGELRWVRVYAHPVWDSARNRLTGIVGAVQDVTASKQTEADRERLIKELESKNAELERFTYTVSHDLKSPLVTIKGFLGYLEKDAQEGRYERLAENVQRVNNAADKMQELLNDLLELSRIGRLTNPPARVPFDQIVREALDMVRGALNEKRVRVEAQEGLPVVNGDRVRLAEALQNLVENAIKFMGEQPSPRIQIGTGGCDADYQAVFFVRDNGQGFDPQFSERIFGLFNKLDANTEGTGIGLALVKRIIEFHGGRVWAESKPGEGATFYFTLPVVSRQSAEIH
ncbi:MAG: ATP-binding protein [Chloroflexota bacterium]